MEQREIFPLLKVMRDRATEGSDTFRKEYKTWSSASVKQCSLAWDHQPWSYQGCRHLEIPSTDVCRPAVLCSAARNRLSLPSAFPSMRSAFLCLQMCPLSRQSSSSEISFVLECWQQSSWRTAGSRVSCLHMEVMAVSGLRQDVICEEVESCFFFLCLLTKM